MILCHTNIFEIDNLKHNAENIPETKILLCVSYSSVGATERSI